MTKDLMFRGRCWSAELLVKKCSITECWSMQLGRFVGKTSKFRQIVFVCGSSGDPYTLQGPDLPRLDLEDEERPMLWLRGAAIDLPASILPSLQAFLAEHAPTPATAKGGAA